MRLRLSLIISTLVLAGCATSAAIPPSQNASLQAVSPNTEAASEGGAMQRALDAWLKEEWTPLSTPKSVVNNGGEIKDTSESSSAPNVKEEKPFTLQSYADKWKVYNENKAKMNEGKPKEASHIERIQKMPVIGE